MAQQRIPHGKNIVDDRISEPKNAAIEQPFSAPAVPTDVIIKLLGFTLAMAVGPIGIYFLVVSLIGNTTVAGAVAAVTANVVLIAYVVVAMREDQSDAIEAAAKSKKTS